MLSNRNAGNKMDSILKDEAESPQYLVELKDADEY